MIATVGAEPLLARADQLKKRGRAEVYTGVVKAVGADGNVDFEINGTGEITFGKDETEWAKADTPADWATLLAAMDAQKYAEAARGLKPVVNRLLGLPEPGAVIEEHLAKATEAASKRDQIKDPKSPDYKKFDDEEKAHKRLVADLAEVNKGYASWIGNAALRLGDCYVNLKSWRDASEVFRSLKERYPSSGRILKLVEVGQVKIYVGQGQYDEALKLIDSLVKVEPVSKLLTVPAQDSPFYAAAYLVQGDCLAGKKQWKDAVLSYLTVEVFFYHDGNLLGEARYRAGKAFEELGEWNRAAWFYKELLSDTASKAPYLDDVKKRLAAIEEKAKQASQP